MYPFIIFRLAQLGMSQKELACKANININSFRTKMRGDLEFTYLEQKRIRDALKWPSDMLFVLFMTRKETMRQEYNIVARLEEYLEYPLWEGEEI